MYKRINVTLPQQTVQLIDRVTSNGNRSRFIDTAVRRYVEQLGRANLRRQLAEGAERNSALDLELLGDWFPVDHEAWQKLDR